jgi:ribosomal protein S18 acetylase RimI-like enzyme
MMAQMEELVTTYHLEINDPADFTPTANSRTAYEVIRAGIPLPELNRFLYASVGADWRWYMRLTWDYARWRNYLERPEVGTWIAYVDGTPAGYFELEQQPPDSVEIAYFGLLPQFIGGGIGGALLTDAVNAAFEFGAGGRDGTRVWLHTCTLDHPAALSNYQARGFRIFDTVEEVEEVPDGPMDPWPGAGRVD